MSLKPIKLYSHAGGPNPWKVVIIFEELGIPYDIEYPDMSTLHTPAYEKYNPNGRVPTIIDPNNNDFKIWESGAIIEYLTEKYDPEHKLHSAPGSNEAFLEKQFLYFQVSGQGPYFGQYVWFTVYHQEKLESAADRYKGEFVRVTKVLNAVLEGKEYLVGEKLSYADLSFLTWYWVFESLPGLKETWAQVLEENKAFASWYERLNARSAVKKVRDDRVEVTKKSHK